MLNHLRKVLLGVVSTVRLWKQQLNLFLTDPRDLEGVIWKSLQLLEPFSMEGIIPREVSHVSPCDAASAPPYFPASPGIHSPEQTSGLSSLVAELHSPVLLHSLGGVGLQMSKQTQVISVQIRSLETLASNKTQHPSAHVLQHGPLSPRATLSGSAKLCSKGEEAREGPGQEECRQSLHPAFWWKGLVTVCLEGKALESDLYLELVGILSKAHNASSLQQNI